MSDPSASLASLSLEELARCKRLPVDFLRSLGLSEDETGVRIAYHDSSGRPSAYKKRSRLKANEGSYWPKGRPLCAYGQHRLHEARKNGILFVVEGESDCWALWRHGLPAVGIPGAAATHTFIPQLIESVHTLYLHKEADTGGGIFIQGLRAGNRPAPLMQAFFLIAPKDVAVLGKHQEASCGTPIVAIIVTNDDGQFLTLRQALVAPATQIARGYRLTDAKILLRADAILDSVPHP